MVGDGGLHASRDLPQTDRASRRTDSGPDVAVLGVRVARVRDGAVSPRSVDPLRWPV